MAWTTPYTFVANNILTAAQLNTNVKDNTAALYAGGLALASQASGDWMQASSATQWARVQPFSPLLFSGYTPVGNVTTGETDLMTGSLAAGLLGTNGWGLEIVGAFNAANNGNTKTVKFKLGVNTYITFVLGTGAASGHLIYITILRITGTTQIMGYSIASPSGIGAAIGAGTVAGAETLSGSLACKFTGQATSTNDISQVLMTVRLIRVP